MTTTDELSGPSPPFERIEKNDQANALEYQKITAEIQKLHEETVRLKKEGRSPWFVKVAVTAAIASVGGGFGGYVFGDSLAARSRAETRKEVLKIYFGVDNKVVGKRKQVLTFIEDTLAKDDPDLTNWVNKEKKVVDQYLREANTEIQRAESGVLRNGSQDRQLQQLRDDNMMLSCTSGLSVCGGRCVDKTHDPANCGVCGVACGPGQLCLAGTCVLNCPTGTVQCAKNKCAELSSDHANCGACGNICGVGTVCANGACGWPTVAR